MKLPLIAIPAALCTEDLYRDFSDLGGSAGTRVAIPDGDSISACAAQVLANAPSRFNLVGTSWGAQVALEIALNAPERVAALCLIGVNAGPHPNPSGVEALADGIAETFDATVQQFADECIYAPADAAGAARATFVAMAAAIGPGRFARQLRSLASRPDRRSDLADLEMPLLLMWGIEDQVTPLARTRPFLASVPQARLEQVDRCGHLPTLEQPARSKTVLEAWLAEIAGD